MRIMSTPTIIQDLANLGKLNETTERMIEALTERPRLGEPSGPPHPNAPLHIGPRHLKPLEEYKPTAKNPRIRNV